MTRRGKPVLVDQADLDAQQQELATIRERLAGVESALEKLASLFLEDLSDDDRVKAEIHGPVLRRDKLPPAVLKRARQQHALRNRVKRAAMYYGMDFEEWVELHGMRDRRFPDGVDPREPTNPRRSGSKQGNGDLRREQ